MLQQLPHCTGVTSTDPNAEIEINNNGESKNVDQDDPTRGEASGPLQEEKEIDISTNVKK